MSEQRHDTSEQRHDWVGNRFGSVVRPLGRRSLTISCDDCSLQCTEACTDCVVTFVLQADEHAEARRDHDVQEGLVLDCDQARVVRLLAGAGLVPELRFTVAG